MPGKKISEVVTSSVASAAAAPSGLAKPVVDAGRRASGSVAGPVEWYLEQWENVIEEARAARMDAATPDANSILAGLPQARAVSECPGRVRLSVRQIKGQHELAYEVVEVLAKVPGIRRVEASPVTGTIVISYNTRSYPSLDALRQRLGER